jgi:hypothetical protein
MSTPSALPNEFTELWNDALAKFKESTGVDPLTDKLASPIASCKDADEVMIRLDDEMEAFESFRAEDSRWGKLRNNYIKPLVDFVLTVNDVAGEAASAFVCLALNVLVF